MANSRIIGYSKNEVIKSLIQDPLILTAIDSPDIPIDSPEDFIGKYIFNYHQNPLTIRDVQTFITVQAHEPLQGWHDDDAIYARPTIEIWVISHYRHMAVTNIPKITQNRNDYLAELIDRKINGSSGFGIGKMRLITNIEGAFQSDYLYRKLVFEGLDVNGSLCTDE